ncbi:MULTISPECIES: copper homeostasis protein CutC [unclassified Paenibacillus]|uniref:PF03932 family protein CutC n=1 Tax=Paenibacillus provencensis TaxID=441151 RepID=A0ABW3PR17_9BACL|nr:MULTISPECIES: copper homeostasis protein CutC [unclassified Paenibacillus]MCM3126354.1 copper homeostasis protein CutC [Paenibacillus sp. MER 78]SFS60740.1 copper homeostasis protein [Paenibacillus sp. 453mf]
MLLEIIATTVDDAVTAEKYGADRLELITAITEGGLTPGIGLVSQVVKSVSIPVHVMVRPHSRSFVYSKSDVETMVSEIEAIRQTGAAGIVLGALTPDGKIDEQTLEQLLSSSGDMQVTFHRAFDELEDQLEGLRTLAKYPAVTRVLTSGGPNPAPQSIPQIRRLVEQTAASQLRILAGSGLKRETIMDFIEQTGVTEIHFGSGVRHDQSGLQPIDSAELKALSGCIHEYGQ